MSERTAYFVKLPFRLEDLRRPHLVSAKNPYVIEKTITLAIIDYENFVTDMTVERWFIEENRNLCYVDANGLWHCLLVRRRSSLDGVLVMSDGRDYPLWAAYIEQT
ncbi:MAG: hypothetical protein ACOX0U_00175 [Oscillospiraceae bacterium]|jgi:hypothetical protein